LLRRLLRLTPTGSNSLPEPELATAHANHAFRTREGVRLLWGLQLRKVFKGKEYFAEVEPAGIRVDGIDKVFMSPSLARIAVTGYNTNGWVFWEYRDDKGQWKPLDELRKLGT
jgi:hypothetical protein